ncbi:MAG: histidine kinase, partial [Desulfohalobiaceae bacterium]|nr:histidine kinase [Desulfohalobiaceae bacterium]
QVQEEDFEVISSEISWVGTIVQNFLEFSRPPKLRMRDCNPETIITSVLQLMQHRLQVSDVEAVYQPPEDFPEGRADPERLKEALINLVVNACEAMPNGGQILIRQELDQKESRPWLVLKVEDTGPGISEDIRDRILQPFFSTKEDGTGLGLSIVERIVTEHQGRLVVHSREGQGTCFEIRLPWSTTH